MKNQKIKPVIVIGAGMAGSEAAWFLAERNIPVILFEGKKKNPTPAQKLKTAAELVCTNSLKSKEPFSAHGILKHEMNSFGSLILKAAEVTSVPAGDALAVDRALFSEFIEDKLKNHPLITFIDEEVSFPESLKEKYDAIHVIIASGPLTTKPLEEWMMKMISADDFYFYDAIAPVVSADSLDLSVLYYKNRHDENRDYLNVPLNKEEYENFIQLLVAAEKVPAKDFEDYKFFESCLPIDTMAERGIDTARYSCMKPLGLEKPDGEIPYACVQLRRENLQGEAYNLVGFQTRLTYSEQLRVLRALPGFSNAQFLHLGSVHRNSYFNAAKLLNEDLTIKALPDYSIAGQLCGVEGYTESASMGIYAALQVYLKIKALPFLSFPKSCGMGALIHYIFSAPKPVPSNINFGLLPPVVLTKEDKKIRSKIKKVKKEKVARIAIQTFDEFYLLNKEILL